MSIQSETKELQELAKKTKIKRLVVMLIGMAFTALGMWLFDASTSAILGVLCFIVVLDMIHIWLVQTLSVFIAVVAKGLADAIDED